jgi:hypothetical protein
VGSRKYSTATLSVPSVRLVLRKGTGLPRESPSCVRASGPASMLYRHACLSSLQRVCAFSAISVSTCCVRDSKVLYAWFSIDVDLQAEFLHVTYKFLSPLVCVFGFTTREQGQPKKIMSGNSGSFRANSSTRLKTFAAFSDPAGSELWCRQHTLLNETKSGTTRLSPAKTTSASHVADRQLFSGLGIGMGVVDKGGND